MPNNWERWKTNRNHLHPIESTQFIFSLYFLCVCVCCETHFLYACFYRNNFFPSDVRCFFKSCTKYWGSRVDLWNLRTAYMQSRVKASPILMSKGSNEPPLHSVEFVKQFCFVFWNTLVCISRGSEENGLQMSRDNSFRPIAPTKVALCSIMRLKKRHIALLD